MNYCKACGNPVHQTAIHCPLCGAVQNTVPAVVATTHNLGLMAMAVAGMILGIYPLLAYFGSPVWTRTHALGAAVLAVAALALGCVSTAKPHRARGIGIAAVVLGVIGLLMALISMQPG